MKLHKIELLNFRQFKGENTIEFADSSEKNVTVIYGENGRGKTGLFRSLIFCLYGERTLPQDEGGKEENSLINEVALEKNIGKEVASLVKINFSHMDVKYELSRKLNGLMQEDHKVITNKEVVELQITEGGNTGPKIVDREKIKSYIQKILNERVRDYFLFDGERMERLTRNSSERRKEVQLGIRALLDLDALELSTKGLKKLSTNIMNEISNQSTGEFKIETSKLTETEKAVEKLELEKEELESERESLKKQLNEISEIIGANEETQKTETKREEFRLEIESKKTEKEKGKNKLKEFLNKSGQILSLELLKQLNEELDLRRNKGELPPHIRIEFIEKLLNEEMCICGNSLDHDHEQEREKLQNFVEQFSKSGLTTEVEDLLGYLNKISGNKLLLENFKEILVNNNKIDNAINETDKKIKVLDDKLEGSSKVMELVKSRTKLQEKLKNRERDILKKDFDLNNKRDEQKELSKKVKRLGAQNEQCELLKDRHELVLETNERLLEIYDSFSKDKRKELEDEANRVFEKFADDSTKKDITNLTIDDQYELGTANWAGKNFLGELSAGQRQLVSLCFITALIRIAGNIEVPLFMDTPFGRLGGSPREKLLKSVPGLISQWILLATDTEFTSIEADILKNTGHWGKVYVLEKLDAGITKIVNNNVDGFVPKREYSN